LSGAQITFPSGACYEVNGSSGGHALTINDLNNVLVNGNGATFDDPMSNWPTNSSIWEAEGGSNITFENMTIDGSNPYGGCLQGDVTSPCSAEQGCYTSEEEYQFGIDYEATQGGTVNNVTVNDVGGDDISLEDLNGNVNSLPNTGITIENSTFNNNGRMGIGVVDANGVTINNNTFTGVCWEAVDMESDVAAEYSANVTITNNTVTSSDFGLLSDGGSASAAHSGPVIVTGNISDLPSTSESNISIQSIVGQVTSSFTINDNTLSSNGAQGIYIGYQSNGVVNGNTVTIYYSEPTTYVVDLSQVSNAKVTNNTGLNGTSGSWAGGVYTDGTDTNITKSGNSPP
jgi:parallel beta-helix repeat protein